MKFNVYAIEKLYYLTTEIEANNKEEAEEKYRELIEEGNILISDNELKIFPDNITREISLKWCIEDVLMLDNSLTEKQAGEVLDLVKRRHDCEYGVCWENLRCAINEIKNEEEND